MPYSGLGNISSFVSCSNQTEHFQKNIGCHIISISAKFMTAQNNGHILWCGHTQILKYWMGNTEESTGLWDIIFKKCSHCYIKNLNKFHAVSLGLCSCYVKKRKINRVLSKRSFLSLWRDSRVPSKLTSTGYGYEMCCQNR